MYSLGPILPPARVNHSKNAIVKPQGPTPQEEKREVEEAMKRIKEASQAIAKALAVNTIEGEYTCTWYIRVMYMYTHVHVHVHVHIYFP